MCFLRFSSAVGIAVFVVAVVVVARLHRRWRRDELLSLIFYEERAAIKTKYNGPIEPCESRADFFAAYPPRRSVFEIPNDETSDNWM